VTQLETKIIRDRRNPIFRRREIDFEVLHEGAGTPDRASVRKALASKTGGKLDNIYILDLLSETGTNKSHGRADLYESPQTAEQILPKHLLIRNMSPEEKAKTEQEKGKKAEEKKEKKAPEKPEKKKKGAK